VHEPRTELDEVAALNQFTADRQRRLVGQAFAGTAVLGSATRFVNALGLESTEFGGAFPRLDRDGASAFVRLLGEHPAFSDPRSQFAALPIVGVDGRRAPRATIDEIVSFLIAGAIAVGIGGDLENDVEGLVRVGVGADDLSALIRTLTMRGTLPELGERPFTPPDVIQIDKLRGTCVMGVVGALTSFAQAARGAVARGDAIGIESVAPTSCCPGDKIQIRGSGFGSTRPAGVELVFPTKSGGCKPVQALTWSDTLIEAIAPDDVGAGCIGFVRQSNGGAEATLQEAASQLAGELESCIGLPAAGAAHQLNKVPLKLVSCPPCLPAGENRLQAAGRAKIDWFSIRSNGTSVTTVSRGAQLELSWSVQGVSSVTITRVGSTGPAAPTGLLPAKGTAALGAFDGITTSVATYRLEATNSCGNESATASVTMTEGPHLNIVDVHVAQAIPLPYQPVTLVAGKRTCVRAFVTSGLPLDWIAGAGPGQQPGVTGSLLVTHGDPPQTTVVSPPLNPNGSITAGPFVDPNKLEHSLLFELPLELTSGTIEIHPTVRVGGMPSSTPGASATRPSPSTVTFVPQAKEKVLPILIFDSILLFGPPTQQELRATLAGALARMPLDEGGFIVKPRIETTTPPWIDLRGELGWNWLVLNLTTLIFLFPTEDVGGLRTGLVPDAASYALNGIGTPRIGATVPAIVARAGLPATLAHEWGHAYGLGHAPCPPPPSPGAPAGVDYSLPGTIPFAGVNVPARKVIASGTGELMSYCSGQSRWPSPNYWEYVRVRVPIF
jgi:hypothetical protein